MIHEWNNIMFIGIPFMMLFGILFIYWAKTGFERFLEDEKE